MSRRNSREVKIARRAERRFKAELRETKAILCDPATMAAITEGEAEGKALDWILAHAYSEDIRMSDEAIAAGIHGQPLNEVMAELEAELS